MTHSLAALVELWWQAVDDLSSLLETLEPEDWSRRTDLDGWDVRAIAAHTAHLEALLAGAPHDDVGIGEQAHVTGPFGRFTEQGVVARRDRSPDQLVAELRSSATTRHAALQADPPSDPEAPAPGLFGAIGWSTETLLRNRPLDLWMHEQDVRRAVGRPGNLDGSAATHATDYLAESVGYVLGKRVAAPAGTTLALDITGHATRGFAVGDDGRGRTLAEPPPDPTVRLTTDRETFLLLAGGRRSTLPGAVRVEGDRALGQRVLASMAVTP